MMRDAVDESAAMQGGEEADTDKDKNTDEDKNKNVQEQVTEDGDRQAADVFRDSDMEDDSEEKDNEMIDKEEDEKLLVIPDILINHKSEHWTKYNAPFQGIC
jgi:hypothetical protein